MVFVGPLEPPKIEAKNDAMPMGTRKVMSIAFRSPKKRRRSFQRRARTRFMGEDRWFGL